MQSVLETAKRGGWILTDHDQTYRLSSTGERMRDQSTLAGALREMVMQLAVDLRPSWVRLAMRGRAAVLKYAPPEVVQCLVESGLADSVDSVTVAWWDRLSLTDRSEMDQGKLDEGRRGERLSCEFERLRTGREPRWVALENSTTGYDVLSSVSDTDSTPLVIEVKTTVQGWRSGRFWLTRNEWDVLSRSEHARVHLWGIAGESLQFSTVETGSLLAHIPWNQGSGSWEVVSIRFSDVASEFVEASRVQDILTPAHV